MIKLTPRQYKIVGHLAQGWKQKDLAMAMGTSHQVISMDVKRIRQRQGSLEKAIEQYLAEENQWSEDDEQPEADEPTGPVQRCPRCNFIEPHECVSSVNMYRSGAHPYGGIDSAADDLDLNRTRPRTFVSRLKGGAAD